MLSEDECQHLSLFGFDGFDIEGDVDVEDPDEVGRVLMRQRMQ